MAIIRCARDGSACVRVTAKLVPMPPNERRLRMNQRPVQL